MALVTETDLGTNVQSFTDITSEGSYLPQFVEYNMRIPTNVLKRVYLNFHLEAATTAGSPYVLGIMPFKGYLVSCQHVVETVTSAATIEVESSTSAACMTADAAGTTVQTATLASDSNDCVFDQGDIISLKVATASGELVNLAILLAFEPIW